ncbi:FAD/NAD(P)-binding domain-containing protein [Acaromyces ingoldii]|uniref:FAD/NAD(P)-binding domain-containing protein n=1 Tax=Acaromyces ingoldii TaxID=215250 RepID=A0A316YBM3_9BASI|nr:FAD/NAD(P)-binding domain-containing protein [Acaromyces ingoldii]PWN86702.1 FAD/NAD(P)-binding domain-containing protein [Acaromyces ingoldii]
MPGHRKGSSRMKRAGVSFTTLIFEGISLSTPGLQSAAFISATVLIKRRLYSLSYAQRTTWDDFFSGQNEIHDYTMGVVRNLNLGHLGYMRHQVLSADYDAISTHWIVLVKDLVTDKVKTYSSRILFSCVGALSIPRNCDISGWKDFKGSLFHSAEWRQDVDLAGKNVVVLGNGCSAAQIVPEIAPKVKSLLQIVRAKHWIAPQFEDIFGSIPFMSWMEKNVPGVVSLQRYIIAALLETHFLQTFKEDGKGARERFAALSRNYVQQCAPPEYHDIIIPKNGELEVACKRRIFDSSGYIPCLGRKNVDITNDQAARIEEDSVILRSGRKVEADVIVLANGFKTDQFACQMAIRNAEGMRLEEYWKEKKGAPQAYRTLCVSSFPNFFMIWGPSSVTGHFSAIHSIERSVELAMRILRPVFMALPIEDKSIVSLSPLHRSAGRSVEVKSSAEDFEQAFIQSQMKDLIFTTGCASWYVDEATGRVTAVNPSFQTTVAWRSLFPQIDDYLYSGMSAKQAWKAWTLGNRLASLLRLGSTPDVRPIHARRDVSYLSRLWARITWLPRQLFYRLFVFALRVASVLADKATRYKIIPPPPLSERKSTAPVY